jgi:anaerobic magnesium-protoporphyrin IX monomethyl ester cyclase
MDVILLHPPRYRRSRGPSPVVPLPLGLLAVATPLDLAGYKVKILELKKESNWEDTLLAELKTRPICVGVTSWTGPQIWWGLKASEIVKQHSDVPVVWGGVHPSLLPQQTLENPYIDIVVQGEGEETFLELVRALGNRQPLDKIRGIWYKEGGRIKQNPPRPFIDLNQQPLPSYHLIDLKKYLFRASGKNFLSFETSRGCPFNCTFCYNTCFNRGQWRALTAEQTLLRMKHVIETYGVKGILFRDDNFFASPDRAHQILEGIVKQKLDIFWEKGDIRLDLLSQLDDDFLSLIERSGCRSLSVGIESGSQRIADLIGKKIDVSQAIPVNLRLARYRMMVRYFFLLGIPGETEADLAATAALMLRLVDDNQKATEGVNMFVPYPGTELFDLSVQYGLHMPESLEEWSPLSWVNRRRDYPWLSPKMARLLRMLSFCGLFMAKNRTLETNHEISLFFSLVAKLYYPIARRRVAGLHYQFFPELRVAELLGFRGY